MENPVAEISPIIHLLCQSPPSLQKQTLERYFTRDAAFIHPFCRTGAWDVKSNMDLGPLGNSYEYTCSRFLILAIYRWYKIISPKIELQIDSVAFDAEKLILYVTLHQVFRLFFLPYAMAARPELVVKLTLQRSVEDDREKYHIIEQNDLYQTTEFAKFIDPTRLIWTGIMIWHFFATFVCWFGQVVLAPVSWWEDTRLGRNLETGAEIEQREKKTDIEKVD